MVGDEKDEGERALDASDLPISLKLLKNTKTALSPDSVGQIGQMRHRWKATIEGNTLLEKRENRWKNA